MRSCYLHPPICAVQSLAYVHTREMKAELGKATHPACQFICGTLVVKFISNISIRAHRCFGVFLLYHFEQRLSDCFPAVGDSLTESIPGQFQCLQTYLQCSQRVICEIRWGLKWKYLVKLAFGRDPCVIAHRTVCIYAHKRAQKRYVTKQGIWYLPKH